MDDATKQQILDLQERMRAGELTADEYMIAVTRLTDPEKATEMEGELLISQLPDYSFQDDDDDPIDDDDLGPEDPTNAAQTKNMAIIVPVMVLVIFAITTFMIDAIWATIRASMGY